MATQKRKIAVLGGGVGGLSTAYEIITRQPDWEVTVYQMGWRLGGKCSASRNPLIAHRLEEHGIHVLFGGYENAFHLLRRVYDELGRDWKLAFVEKSDFTLFDLWKGSWQRWDFERPPRAGHPGDRLKAAEFNAPSQLSMARQLTQWVQIEVLDHPGRVGVVDAVPEPGDRGGALDSVLELSDRGSVLDAMAWPAAPLRQSTDAAIGLLSGDCAAGDVEAAIGELEKALATVQSVEIADSAPLQLSSSFDEGARVLLSLRRLRVLAELGLAAGLGLLRNAAAGKKLSDLNHLDLTEWLDANALGSGLSKMARESAPLRMIYEASFEFEDGDTSRPNFAAGTAIRTTTRGMFDYLGSLAYEMIAGSAETIISPLYLALKKRDVRFEFFHRVEEIVLTDDKCHVASVRFSVQSKPHVEPYEPLIGGSDAWPDRPKYDLLQNGDTLKLSDELPGGGYDLEDPRTGAPVLSERVIVWRGHDERADTLFDDVVLAIPVEASRTACKSLLESPSAGERWRSLYDGLKSSPTQSCQLWFDRTAGQLGWKSKKKKKSAALVGCYEQPFGNWADLSLVLATEQWPEYAEALNSAYLCGPLIETEDLEDFDPPHWRETVRANAEKWLTLHGERLWPAVYSKKHGFDWDRLVVVDRSSGKQRFASQFFRANLSPSGRYVLSLKGTTTCRLAADESGFANLYLAGDWTRNGCDNGCVEATVMSAKQAARALLHLTKAQLPVYAEDD